MNSFLRNVEISSKQSSAITYCLWFLLLALCASTSVHAQPSSRIYYAMLGDDGSLTRISPYYKGFFPIARSIPLPRYEENNEVVKRNPMKKYDRNCFFSPVQCMLSYDKNADEALYRGRR